jgi:hypothetical protein
MRKIQISRFCPEYHQDIIPGLQTLTANSPRLTHLDVDSDSYHANSETCTLHDLFNALRSNSDTPSQIDSSVNPCLHDPLLTFCLFLPFLLYICSNCLSQSWCLTQMQKSVV